IYQGAASGGEYGANHAIIVIRGTARRGDGAGSKISERAPGSAVEHRPCQAAAGVAGDAEDLRSGEFSTTGAREEGCSHGCGSAPLRAVENRCLQFAGGGGGGADHFAGAVAGTTGVGSDCPG